MLLDPGKGDDDFQMTYFNSDGSGGMMCGNGGRCMVAFAKDCGVEGSVMPDGVRKYVFTAADGPHDAYVMNEDGCGKTVRLKMKDVDEYQKYETLKGVNVPSEGYFLDTGTRHYVRFVENLVEYDIVAEGREIRYNAPELQPVGANVNFVEPKNGVLHVRTYEKGVEDETFACGTGIVASALAAYTRGVLPKSISANGRIFYDIRARRDHLMVDFLPSEQGVAQQIFLTGPAAKVCEILL
jgi:diaminopimelate epimerase